MAANVDTMFSVREVPWHREGIVLPDYPGSWEAARHLAGLTWEPTSEPVYALAGVDAHGQPVYEQLADWQRIARSDTGKTLSVQRDTYALIDHREMGEIIEAVLAQANVKYETAGSLDEGRAVWCLAMLEEPVTLPGDDTYTLPYVAITNRHDGSGACTLRCTSVRIVCANTFRAAELEGERSGSTYAFVHRSGWRDRITDAQRELFVCEFIPIPPDGLTSERVKRNVHDARVQLRSLFDSATCELVAHTGYGLLQASGEYLDHIRAARSWETKLSRTLLRPEPLKAKALTLIREIAATG